MFLNSFLTGSKKQRCGCCSLTAKPTKEDLSRRKNSQQLKQVLTTPELALLAVGMMVGSGIFAMPGKAIRITGPGLVIACLIMYSCAIYKEV